MIPELPSHLQSTCNVLTGSLGIHPVEKASAMPADLMADLIARFETATPAVVKLPSLSWFEKFQSFVSRPAFGVAALAVVILTLVVPTMVAPAPGSGFRGATPVASSVESVRIILVQAPSDVVRSLENSGDFEKGSITSVTSLPGDQTGARVVVDFTKSEISVINSNAELVSTKAFPADNASLSGAIASAVSGL